MTESKASEQPDGDDAPIVGDLPYAEACRELETILADLERDELDVDRLADRVRRAAELLAICRARIDAAAVEVERIVADLGPAPPA